MKSRKYHIIRITYTDGHVNQRAFYNKDVALRWMKYRKSHALSESVIYAGHKQEIKLHATMKRSESLALKNIR